jgi:hypothetical protein
LDGARPREYFWTIFSVRVCGVRGELVLRAERIEDSGEDSVCE